MVFLVIFFSISLISIKNVSGSISINIGLAPTATTAVAVPDAEWEGINISSPYLIFTANKLRISASVPLLTPTAYFEPQNFENSFSNSLTLLPNIYCLLWLF